MEKLFLLIFSVTIICFNPTFSHGVHYWAKVYGSSSGEAASSVHQLTMDGGYIISGYTWDEDIWVKKLDNNGTVEWKKTYGGEEIERIGALRQTNDGGYVVAGWTMSFSSDACYDAWVLKLNSKGDVEWQKIYENSGSYYYAPSIQQTLDGGYAILLITTGEGLVGFYIGVLKLTSGGDVEWHKTYGWYTFHESTLLLQTLDGGYIIVGLGTIGETYEAYEFILKLDSLGNIAWQKAFEGGVDFESIQKTTDGGYIVAGDDTILKLDSGGNIEWQKIADGSGLYSIQQTQDSGYIVAGGGFPKFWQMWVLKLHNDGEIAWQKSYGEEEIREGANSIQQTLDEGYIVAGNRDGNAWVLKLDNNGEIPNCNLAGDTHAILSEISSTALESNFTAQETTVNVADTNIIPHETSVEISVLCNYSDMVDIDGDGVQNGIEESMSSSTPFGQEVQNSEDNCTESPNGPYLGTCVKMVGGMTIGTGATCIVDGACATDEICDMNQGDCNSNNVGDACECYADCDCNTKIDLADLVLMKQEFLRTDCDTIPCQADCNGDDKVDLSDLVVMKEQFLQTDCPPCP